MKSIQKALRISFICSFLSLALSLNIAGSSKTSAIESEESHPTNGLLIFLDDSEEGFKGNKAISVNVYSAVVQGAGPIIASASLIVNLRDAQIDPELKNMGIEELTKAYQEQYQKMTKENSENEGVLKSLQTKQELEDKFFPAFISHNFKTAMRNWIIKEINPSLYLLLPNDYLSSKNFNAAEVGKYISKVRRFFFRSKFTTTEVALGLKVNLMKTASLAEIKKPMPAPDFASYFMDAINRDEIFITKNEYAPRNKQLMPYWGIYIDGHGLMGATIVDLFIPYFKDLLTFLESKLLTQILVYQSCYAAGVNTQLIYETEENSLQKTYPFPIITTAITDAPTKSGLPSIIEAQGKITIKTPTRFDNFLKKLTQPGIINYSELIIPIARPGIGNTPQLKLPGLPWFSALESRHKVVEIGSVLAKTRSAPLNIGSFFKRQGNAAEPRGILLYAQDIPFELVIDTKEFPAIVSMIPGDAVHHIKKISSSNHTISEILDGFKIDYGPRKIFLIDEITARPMSISVLGKATYYDAVQNVVIESGEKFKSYFGYKSLEYKYEILYPLFITDFEDTKAYQELLNKYAKLAQPTAPLESLEELQAQAEKQFSVPLPPAQVTESIQKILDAMPDRSLLHIPKITVVGLPVSKDLAEDLIGVLRSAFINYQTFSKNKLLRIDAFEGCDDKKHCARLTDVIGEIKNSGIRIYFKNPKGQPVIMTKAYFDYLLNDYMPLFEKGFKYFETLHRLPEDITKELENLERSSVYELITPESIKKISEISRAHGEKTAKDRKEKGAEEMVPISPSSI